METVTAVNDRILALALMAAVAGCSISRTPGTTMPTTPRRPVTDEYHGVRVVDDYRWLEHGDDPEVRRWTEQQNRFTSATLDTIAARPQILQRLQAISRSTSATYSGLAYRDGALFALKALPPARHPYLVRMTGPDDLTSERVVVDPNTLDSSGSTTIDFYVPSPDGRLVALSLSRSGTENGTLHVYETATGRALNDTIAHINDATAAGSVAWNEAATGLYYTRYPRRGERPPDDAQISGYHSSPDRPGEARRHNRKRWTALRPRRESLTRTCSRFSAPRCSACTAGRRKRRSISWRSWGSRSSRRGCDIGSFVTQIFAETPGCESA